MADEDIPVTQIRMEAKLVLPSREHGKRWAPPYIFSGYRCSNIRPAGNWPEAVGAAFYPVGRDVLHVGEIGLVQMEIYGESWLVDKLCVGTLFRCFEAGRSVAVGKVTALLGPWTFASGR